MANILSLTVENFRSYKNKTTFSFEAVNSPLMEGNYHVVKLNNGKQISLLNSAVIYGANGAGKSNMIIALFALFSFVKFSKRYDPHDEITYEPYKFSSQTRNVPISFMINFVVDGEEYAYQFSYDRKSFHHETLIRVDDEAFVFERGKEGVTHFNPDILPGLLDETYLPNHLALSELSLKAIPLIQSIYGELTLITAIPLTNEFRRIDITNQAAKWLHDEPNGSYANLIKSLIISSGIGGIVDVAVKERNREMFAEASSMQPSFANRSSKEEKYDVFMLHATDEGEKASLHLNKESEGTRVLFTAGAWILQTLESGGMLAYDEINIALHPDVFKRLVELFNNKSTNPNNAQLLVTTHDTVLIDVELLRADQIWFAEKKNGVSELYSAVDFKGVRIDQPFGPWYRAGRLGGKPEFKSFTIDNNIPKIKE